MKIAEITLARHENVCVCFYTIFVILTVIVLAISIGIGAYFPYSCWYLKKDVSRLALVLNAIAFSRAALKQQFNELKNGKCQTNRDQKLNLLFLQRHN